ncbi:MAG: dipeptide epimerase [Robiginitomaculum sp.]|nr:dipeptide epimerase [Robiginitomaculum sp.]
MARTIELQIDSQNWPISGDFRISRGSKTTAEVIVVTLKLGVYFGRGECVPYARYGETIDSVTEQIKSITSVLRAGLTREELQKSLPAGAARNAVDSAFWDLQAQQSGKPVWQLAGLLEPTTVITAITLSLGRPQQMAKAASMAKDYPLLKVKLAGDGSDPARVRAISVARPDAQLILDGNEGFDKQTLGELLRACKGMNIAAIEQPMPAGADGELAEINTDFVFCADESLHTSDDLLRIADMYQMINIKLDKTGGLTEALLLKAQAKQLGLKIMLGCMVATSLSMAPALLLANDADLVDLDGPLLLQSDREYGLQYQGANVLADPSKLWGFPNS